MRLDWLFKSFNLLRIKKSVDLLQSNGPTIQHY